MYLGGLPDSRAGLILPTELWTAMLNYGYVGCIRDLFIDGRSKDIRQIAEAQNGAGIKPSCNKMPGKQCDSYPCKNKGMCKEGWNRFICDCTGTGYWSRTCERGECIVFAFTSPCNLTKLDFNNTFLLSRHRKALLFLIATLNKKYFQNHRHACMFSFSPVKSHLLVFVNSGLALA